MIVFSKNILYLRKSKGLRQDEMQAACGITRGTWSNYENDIAEPNLDTILRISQYFGIDINTLLTVDLSIDGKVIPYSNADENKEKGKLKGKEIGKVMPIKQAISGPITFQLNEPKDGEEATMWYLFQQVHRLEKEIAKLKDKINNNGHSSQ